MRWWQRVSILILVLCLLAVDMGVANAAEQSATGPIQVYVQNKSGLEIRINLSGPTNVWATLPLGRTSLELSAGVHRYSYWACSQTITGTFIVKKKGDTLKLEKCTSASAGTNSSHVQVNFQNKTGEALRIQLIGPQTFWFTLASGKTSQDLPLGTYRYSYSYCGETVTGTFNIKKKNATLKLDKCKAGNAAAVSGDTVVTFRNQTGEIIRLQLTGPQTVWLTLATGNTKDELPAGTYRYSYNACDGETFTGSFNVKGKTSILKLLKCKNSQATSGKLIKVAVKNNTGGSLSIYLFGDQSYTFYVGTGTTKIEVAPGKYQYTVYGCGGASIGGTKSFRGGGNNWMFWCQ